MEAGSTPTSPENAEGVPLEYYSLAETMAERQEQCGPDISPGTEENVYAQLAQKERDLYLAAELGKALLDKNQELQIKNEQIMEEYTQRLEGLEQEKYEIHLRLEKVESEYQNTVKELQYDITHLRRNVQEQQHNTSDDKEKSHLIQELTRQNEQLAEEVKYAREGEAQMASKVSSLKDQMISRRTSMHEHVNQLGMMQEEIKHLAHCKSELEKKITSISEEREALACTLEETQERIRLLERQKHEHEEKIHNQQQEMMELREENAHLVSQVDSLMISRQRHTSGSSSGQSQNLYSELAQMTASEELGMAVDQMNQLEEFCNDRPQPTFMLMDMADEDDIECDDDDDFVLGASANTSLHDSLFINEFQRSSSFDEEDTEFRQELIQVYRQLKQMCRELHQNRSGVCPEEEDVDVIPSCIRPGSVINLIDELRALMTEIVQSSRMREVEAESMTRCQSLAVAELSERIAELHIELSTTKHDLEHVKMQLENRDLKLSEKTGELSDLTAKLSVQQQELTRLQAERDRLQDQTLGILSRDEVIERARKDRDDAIERRKKMETDLTKAKLNLMSLNSQLMEAIEQKVSIATQLEQWQTDMTKLMADQQCDQTLDKEQECLKKSKSASSIHH